MPHFDKSLCKEMQFFSLAFFLDYQGMQLEKKTIAWIIAVNFAMIRIKKNSKFFYLLFYRLIAINLINQIRIKPIMI